MTGDDAARADGRRWLAAWQSADSLLDEERWARLRALDDDSAWAEAEALFALWEPSWSGDGGEELLLHQQVFAVRITATVAGRT